MVDLFWQSLALDFWCQTIVLVADGRGGMLVTSILT